MNENASPPVLPERLRRCIPLLAVIAISLGTVGFLSGIRDPARTRRPSPKTESLSDTIPSAVSYSELPTSKLLPNANWQQSLEQLRFERPGVFAPVIRTEEMKHMALADRARNRAYDGAPPTIPHLIDSPSATACLVCHGEGIKIGKRVASKISHAHLTSCTQCHVEQTPNGLPFPAKETENLFVGIYRAGPGERAFPGAPPTIPHHTWMRENCASCHGLVTRPGTRTTHPWLTNCTQCHGASATLDQVNFLGAMR